MTARAGIVAALCSDVVSHTCQPSPGGFDAVGTPDPVEEAGSGTTLPLADVPLRAYLSHDGRTIWHSPCFTLEHNGEQVRRAVLFIEIPPSSADSHSPTTGDTEPVPDAGLVPPPQQSSPRPAGEVAGICGNDENFAADMRCVRPPGHTGNHQWATYYWP